MASVLLPVVVIICAANNVIALPTSVREGDDVFATTENGVVRGVVAKSLNGTLFNKFLGIPYAAPPIGDLRFRAPQPADKWSGVRDALEFGKKCPQLDFGHEDCLYINVYVPVTPEDTSLLPVMFHIYGGGFAGGASNLAAPDYFMDKGVIMVSFNYRISSIGFLSLQNDDIPGNAGLKDQVFALRWVQRNIEAFGGDRDSVTIFGPSAGGCSVSHLFLSPATKGLFHGAIMESGDSSSPALLELRPKEKAYRLAAALGFQPLGYNETDDDVRLAAFLRSVDHNLLTANSRSAKSELEKRMLAYLAFVPTIEPPSDTAVVTEMPADVIREGRYNKVPFMSGVTSAEGKVTIKLFGILTDEAFAADMRENFTLLVGAQLPLPTEEEQADAAQKINHFYFGDQGFNTDNIQAVYDLESDFFFIHPADSFARKVANNSDVPVYFYYFDYDGFGASEYGMTHAATVYYYTMISNGGPNKDPESADGKIIELITTLWTNLAKYRDPAPNGNPVTWEAMTANAANYLDMKREFVTRRDLLKDRMDFWRQITP